MINYGFREMTYDADAIITASSYMEDAVSYVGDKYGLPTGWMNDDFKKTESYTPEITKKSIPIPVSMSWKIRRICLNTRRRSRE